MQLDKYLPLLEGQRVAVCGNHTSMVNGTHLVDTLLSRGVNVTAIFCPEHGFRGEAEAGANIQSSKDSKTGLPIISLYGSNKKPTPEQVNALDVILFDIQDVGCRFYTYISTLHYVMEAAAENGVAVIILDRPNPNGYFVDGPVLDPKFRSFVGMHTIPVVHGMTIGEYGQMVNGEGWLSNGIRCQLTVISMLNYDHTMRYSLPIAPSPNLQTDEAVYLYPSLCLFEGTVISVGRGTEHPFEMYGHPDLSAGTYHFTPHPIKGVSENPPLKGRDCRGFLLTENARELLDSTNSFNLEYLLTAYRNYPDKEGFFLKNGFFNKLAGGVALKNDIVAGKKAEDIRASWQPALTAFKAIRAKYLLYPDFE
ncbi:MAG: DUF1343 domain-containing protein [Bacteroidales bacterium]|nr:DUF1343 domain-containing protein [Bacteroidales bacterium]